MARRPSRSSRPRKSRLSCRCAKGETWWGAKQNGDYQGWPATIIEGAQWVVDCTPSLVQVADAASTHGSKLIREGKFTELPHPSQSGGRPAFVELREGDALQTYYATLVFARV